MLTHGDETTGWANSQAIRPEAVAGLKQSAGRPLAVFTGASAAQALPSGATLRRYRVEDYARTVSPRTAAVLVSIRGAGTRRRFS